MEEDIVLSESRRSGRSSRAPQWLEDFIENIEDDDYSSSEEEDCQISDAGILT
jgi:hypothetical protein